MPLWPPVSHTVRRASTWQYCPCHCCVGHWQAGTFWLLGTELEPRLTTEGPSLPGALLGMGASGAGGFHGPALPSPIP